MPGAGERRATVLGCGVAALTCARVLRQRGWDVALRGPAARPVPVLLLGTPTVVLLEEVWGRLDVGRHALRGRRVRWGARPPAEVPDSGLVVDGARLLRELERRSPAGAGREHAGGWILEATGRAAEPRALGRRVVLHACVRLRPDADTRTSCMESVPEGWLFIIPTGADAAVLQAMVPAAPADPAAELDRMLGAARDIGARVARLAGSEVGVLSAAPQTHEPIAAPGRVLVGASARALDPLAGDGTGAAVRGAVLASAALESTAGGMAEEAALDHYDHRVRLMFLRHLAHVLRFYSEAFSDSPAWEPELEPLRRELADPANRAVAARPFAHRLAAGRLEALATRGRRAARPVG